MVHISYTFIYLSNLKLQNLGSVSVYTSVPSLYGCRSCVRTARARAPNSNKMCKNFTKYLKPKTTELQVQLVSYNDFIQKMFRHYSTGQCLLFCLRFSSLF